MGDKRYVNTTQGEQCKNRKVISTLVWLPSLALFCLIPNYAGCPCDANLGVSFSWDFITCYPIIMPPPILSAWETKDIM